jgi:uncharacterized protein (TIGR03089 family)
VNALNSLLARISDPSQPLITYYDMATGERVELSGTTTANWIAKTSNFLVDDLDAERGTRVRIGLPSHWLRAVWILAAWNVGAAIVDSGADIGVCGPDLVADEPHRVAASLRPLGGRFATAPEGFLDLGVEVPGHSDYFMALDPPEPDDLATDLGGTAQTHAQVIDGATPDARRLVVGPGTVARDASLLVNACLGSGSLVMITSGSPADFDRVASQEGGTTHG